VHLRCEHAVRPLGIDVRAPRFSWELGDRRRDAMQTAYRIRVAGAPAALSREAGIPILWDSGRVPSDQSHLVPYGGPDLASARRYWWTVQTWDADGQASPPADPTWFETGLLEPTDWTARWIAAPASPADGEPELRGPWIWHPEARDGGANVFFRRRFDLPHEVAVERASVAITADDRFVLYVNGDEVGRGGSWESVFRFDVSRALRPGTNCIAVEGTNTGGACGLVVALAVRLADGRSIDIGTDEDWRASDAATEDWTAPEHDDAASPWIAAVAIGELGAEPWGVPKERRFELPSVGLRREIDLRAAPVRARAYVTALGLFDLHVNGRRIDVALFRPGWTHYPKRLQYRTFDLTDALHEGTNAVGAILGNGWWSGGLFGGRWSYAEDPRLRFLCQLEVEYRDGGRERFVSDGSWAVHPSPIGRDSFYDGEKYDARLEQVGWDAPGFDAAGGGWVSADVAGDVPAFRLVAEACEPIRVTEERIAMAVTSPTPGAFVFDFGQNLAGFVRLRVRGPRGTAVVIRFAEVANPDGTLYHDNYRSAKATDVYVLRGDDEGEVWEPRFTYRGFRYAEVTGYPGDPPRDALVACVVHTDAPFAGSFRCSEPLLERICENLRWGLRSNLYSVPTDCPQRDERLGWMGDAQAFAPTACWNMDLARFFAKWMRDITDSQAEDGHVTDVAPRAMLSGPAAPGWGDAVTVIPWTTYLFYGDRRILEENFDAMRRWVEYMRAHAPDGLYQPEHGHRKWGYGDWVAVEDSPAEPIATAYYYRSTHLLARAAAVLGREDDAREYRELASRIADAFNARFLERERSLYPGGTQTSAVLPLAFGMVPHDREEAVVANLAANVREHDDHLTTGFLGTAQLLPVLSRGGRHDLAFRLAMQRSYPSWGYMVDRGATTIWERWNSDRIGEVGPGMNSFNHFAFGSVGEWFFEWLAGIRIDEAHPGFMRFEIRPMPVDALAWAQAEHRSPYGLVRSAWWRRDGRFHLDVTVPPNTRAKVWLPSPSGEGRLEVWEGGETVFRGGAEREALPEVEGVRFLGEEAGSTVFDVGAGDYRFSSGRE